jgi:predicted nucleic acid-binding protein
MVGLIARLHSQKIYIDTNIFIYLIEGYKETEELLKEIFLGIDKGYISAVTSNLSLSEVLVKPFIDKNEIMKNLYVQILKDSPIVDIDSISDSVLIDAARIRAEFKIKTPDAIHLATAKETQCDFMLTNDAGMRRYTDIETILVSDYL